MVEEMLVPDDAGDIKKAFVHLVVSNDCSIANGSSLKIKNLIKHLGAKKLVIFADTTQKSSAFSEFAALECAAGNSLALEREMMLFQMHDKFHADFSEQLWLTEQENIWNYSAGRHLSRSAQTDTFQLHQGNKSSKSLLDELSLIDMKLRIQFAEKNFNYVNEVLKREFAIELGLFNMVYSRKPKLDCINLNGKFRAWLQDEIHILCSKDNYTVESVFSLGNGLTSQQVETDMQYIGSKINEKAIGRTGVVDISGGNMLSSENFILVGADEKYQTYSKAFNEKKAEERMKALSSIDTGHVTASNQSYLSFALSTKMLGVNDSKKVIWVGTEKPDFTFSNHKEEKNKAHQPIYHLDLFITLLGIRKNSNNPSGDCVYDLAIAMPDKKWQNMSEITSKKGADYTEVFRNEVSCIISSLRKQIIAIRDNVTIAIRENLKTKYGEAVKVNCIEVPLPLQFQFKHSKVYRTKIYRYVGFLNGQLSDTDEGKKFYFPSYQRESSHKQMLYENAEKDMISKLDNINVEAIPIVGQYGPKAALRCIVKCVR